MLHILGVYSRSILRLVVAGGPIALVYVRHVADSSIYFFLKVELITT